MKVAGTFNGTGAAVYICLGFIPDEIKLWAVEDSDAGEAFFSSQLRAAEADEGYTLVTGTTYRQIALKTATSGLVQYEGGELLTSTNQTSVAYGAGVYLGWDKKDYRQDSTYGYEDSVIDTWTLDTSANRTGHFNSDVVASGNRIGEGSEIWIKEASTGLIKRAIIEALTAGQGISANEVTLSRAIGSGEIMRISGMYSLAPIAIGKVTPQGFLCNITSILNVSGEIQMFSAEKYDN